MNERMYELARQADAYAWQQIDEGADYNEQPRYFAEKFAELIVRECADIGERYADGNYEVPRQILARFGMDEDEE